ncbi:MAG: ABC transporter ATP-binding protein [Pseudomonadota bacterium]
MQDGVGQHGLAISGLSKTYPGGVHALRGIDLAVAPGLYGLLGPNGAGKSTLMRTLATLQQPDAGTITLDGVDVLAQPDRLRSRLGYLPQQIGSYPGVAGRALLRRFAWLKGITDAGARELAIDALLERVNLTADADRAVSTYSGGMLRRFGIALALLGEPRLLVVDEPTAGLDPAERNRFHRVLADLGENTIVLLSTHIVEDIENLCARVAIMAAGRIVAEGECEALRGDLRGRIWEHEIPRGGEVPPAALHLTATPQGTRVVVSGDQPVGYAAREPRLEDVYYAALQHAEAA